jgi:hypothetical protein
MMFGAFVACCCHFWTSLRLWRRLREDVWCILPVLHRRALHRIDLSGKLERAMDGGPLLPVQDTPSHAEEDVVVRGVREVIESMGACISVSSLCLALAAYS